MPGARASARRSPAPRPSPGRPECVCAASGTRGKRQAGGPAHVGYTGIIDFTTGRQTGLP